MKVMANKFITVSILITTNTSYAGDKDNFRDPFCLSCKSRPKTDTEESNKIQKSTHNIAQTSYINQDENQNVDKNNVRKTVIKSTTNNKQKDTNEIQVVNESKQLQDINKFQKNNKLDIPSEWLNDCQDCGFSVHTIGSYQNPEYYYMDNILNLPINFSFVNEDGSYKCYDELMQLYNDPEDYNDYLDLINLEIPHSIKNNKEINKETLKNCDLPVKEKEMTKICNHPVEEKETPKFYNPFVKKKKNNKIDKPLGKKRGRYKKNDSCPKNTAIKSKHGKHGRNSKDNCIQKVKVLVLGKLREFINEKIRKVCKRGYRRRKLLQKIDPKYYSSCRYNNILMNKSINDILSRDLSSKITHLDKDHNSELIKKLEKDNKVEIINILNKTFIQAIEHFSGKSKYKEFEGMETFDKWVNKNSKDDVEYAECLKYVVENFGKIVEEIRRRPGNKNSKINKDLEAFYSNSENSNNINDKTRQDNATTTIHRNNDKSQVGNVSLEDSDFTIEIS